MKTTAPMYTVAPAADASALDADWNAPAWSAAQTVTIGHFYDIPQASRHRPLVQARLLHDRDGIYLHFRVEDRYVRCVQTEYQASVCTDSCVEWFVEPVPDRGYFNFEINAGGNILLMHVTGDLRKNEYTFVSNDWLDRVLIRHTLPAVVEPEIQQPTTWRITAFIPLDLFRAHLPGQTVSTDHPWRCNFYKCADATSHPHWASWRPVDVSAFSFHQPPSFAPIVFGQESK